MGVLGGLRVGFQGTHAQAARGTDVVALLDGSGPLVRGVLLQVLGAHAPHGPQAARVRLPGAAAAAATSCGCAAAAALAGQTVDLPCEGLWRICNALAGGGRAGMGLGTGEAPATWATFTWASGREVGAEARAESPNKSAHPVAPAACGAQAGRLPAGLARASSEQTGAWASQYGGIWGLHSARRALGFGSPPILGLADALPGTAASQASGAVLIVCRLEHVELAALAHLSGCAVLAACMLAPDPVAAVASRWLVRLSITMEDAELLLLIGSLPCSTLRCCHCPCLPSYSVTYLMDFAYAHVLRDLEPITLPKGTTWEVVWPCEGARQ